MGNIFVRASATGANYAAEGGFTLKRTTWARNENSVYAENIFDARRAGSLAERNAKADVILVMLTTGGAALLKVEWNVTESWLVH